MEKTKIALRNLVIYQVFVRNHTPKGTFQALIPDLDRIKNLGVDVVYLLPIHPIGKKNRKGTLGSPYSIQDYRLINPELGTMSDFQDLIDAVHAKGMKIMIDEVLNHTSRDSRLLKEHPEYFYKNAKGEFANRVGEWWDVTDLDYTKDKGLWIELADTLKTYAEMGVDGFRMDVASLVPLDFWRFARKVVSKVNKNVFWLSESVHGGFCKYLREQGFSCSSESEIYQVFDMAYDYDVEPFMKDFQDGNRPLKDFVESIQRQDEIYPENYIKMKNLENHDLERLVNKVGNDMNRVLNWNAFLFFQKGATMIYAGQEYMSDHRPDLFDKDLIVKHEDISDFIRPLTQLKKNKAFMSGKYQVQVSHPDGIVYLAHENDKEKWIGLFNLKSVESGNALIDLPDGTYTNILNKKRIKVKDKQTPVNLYPIIIKVRK